MFERVKAYWPWIERGFVLVLIVALVYAWNRAHRERADLTQELERQKLVNNKMTAELEVKQRDLNAAEKKIIENDAAFAEEKARLVKTLGEKPTPITIIKWKTKEVPAYMNGPPEAPRECPVDAEGKPTRQVIVLEGDTGHVEVSEVTYETKEDNHVFVATGSCWRDTPSPRLIFTSAVQGPAPVALRKTEDDKPFRWGLGLQLSATSEKAGLGPAVLFPLFELWGLQLDSSAGASFGSTGFVAASAQAGLRWR